MIVGWLLLAVAGATECPDVREQIAEAWRLFDDAEVAAAKALLAEANANLACQTWLVPAADQLELYRLDGLVSLALDDRKGAVYATLRAVAADHLGALPPDEYGPDLQELYVTWSERLSETTITLSVEGGGIVYVDGRRADRSAPIAVVEGEHVIQFEDDMGIVRSIVAELTTDQVLYTGTLAEDGGVAMAPVTAEEPPADPVVPPPAATDRGRRRPLALGVAGGSIAAVGGVGVLVGWLGERQLLDSPYTDAYYDCAPQQSCYPEAREHRIRADATRVRVTYGAGYGLAAVGAGLFATWAIGLPVHTDGRTVGFAGRF